MTDFGRLQRIELKGRVLHSYPQGDFDSIALEEAVDQVKRVVVDTDRWVLFVHTAADAGLTTSSIVRQMELYADMAGLGCQGVAIGGDSLLLDMVHSFIPQEFIIPIKVSKDDQLLTAFLESLL